MSRALRAKKQQPTLTDERPQTATAEGQPKKKGSPPGRQANGQFARGNPGGPGNPHARFSAHMLTIARQTMTPEKMAAVFESIYIKALTGDLSAAKLLLHYTIGKPGDAPHPDHIERDEWDLYQKNAMTLDEMKQTLGRLPCSLGNEIVGAALPSMTATFASDIASKLMGGEGQEAGGENNEKSNEGPLTNRQSDGVDLHSLPPRPSTLASSRSRRPSRASTPSPLTNRETESVDAQSPGTPDQPSHTAAPSPLTNRESDSVDPRSLAPRPATDASSRSPLTNGKTKPVPQGGAKRNSVAKHWLQPLARKLNARAVKRKKARPVHA